jgi:ketosteroid isomerase-like protein
MPDHTATSPSAPSPGEHDELWALADRLFAAIEAGNLDAVAALYDDDLRVWSNVDGRELDRERALKLLRWLTTKLDDRRYEIRRREVLPDGFLQEHVLRGTAPDGSEIAMPACLVVTVRDGRFVRIHEYLDASQVAALGT